MQPLAILFDMDGCLVDSEPVINTAAILTLKEWGIDAQPEDFAPFVGHGEERYLSGVVEHYRGRYDPQMKRRLYEIYLEQAKQIQPHPGAKECLDMLSQRGFKMALASSADHVKIDANLRGAGIARSLFGAVVGAEDVIHKKPAPDLYLKAAQTLGVEPQRCIVVEDAPAGILAARRAGMTSIALATTFDAETLRRSAPDAVCENFEQVCKTIVRWARSFEV